uniref:Uncharacterized protein n=1 Tax=Arundo donax TaxID=35708 RepID=A0A0A8YEV7_ARUDO
MYTFHVSSMLSLHFLVLSLDALPLFDYYLILCCI